MVVVAIMGLFAGLVSVIVQPDERARLDVEAQRLARLLELVVVEAQVSGMTFAWSAEPDAYHFLQLSETSGWLDVQANDLLRPRHLPDGMTIAQLMVENALVEDDMRVEFPAYGQTTAFTVDLVYGPARSHVVVSPIGAVSVITDTNADSGEVL
jgi:general secretion pathway protein H